MANEKQLSLLKQFLRNIRSKTPECRKLGHSSHMQNDALMYHEGSKGHIIMISILESADKDLSKPTQLFFLTPSFIQLVVVTGSPVDVQSSIPVDRACTETLPVVPTTAGYTKTKTKTIRRRVP